MSSNVKLILDAISEVKYETREVRERVDHLATEQARTAERMMAVNEQVGKITKTIHGNGTGGCVRTQEKLATRMSIVWGILATVGVAIVGIAIKLIGG